MIRVTFMFRTTSLVCMLRHVSIFLCTLLCMAAAPSNEPVGDFALILNSPSLSERPRQLSQNRTAQAEIRAEQQSLQKQLAQRGIPCIGAASTLVNAVFVRLPMKRAAELQSVPGVRSTIYLPPLHRHLNRALDLVNASAAWSQVGGQANAGAGVKIAVIDSGIDQNHPAMQDPSLQTPAGYPLGNASFTNSKVIVARSYVSQLPFPGVTPQFSLPDDTTPSDHFGHGTAIAMIAAGAPVQAPLASISGVAPKAWLGNYKVYGTPGINDQPTAAVVIQALEDALNDGMNIAILASGSAALFGPYDQVAQCQPQGLPSYIPGAACDVLSFAVEHAIQMGMAVVVSAGEDAASGYNFPAYATINSPGTAPDAITVGATTNSHLLYNTASLTGSGIPANLTSIDALFGRAPKPGGPFTAPLVDVTTLGNDGLACDPLPLNSLTGSIAFIQRGTCSFDFKSNNAKTAGAVAVLLYLEAGDDTLFFPIGLEDTAMPLVAIGNTSGTAIKSYLAAHPGTKVTLDPAWHEETSTPDIVADYSSRGPSIGVFSASSPPPAVKPELVAPGGNIYTAAQRLDPNGDLYDASGYTTVEGNSFSAAIVAGAVALVKQAHPGYTPAQLKSAVVNTASGNLQDDAGPARVRSSGAGKLNVQAAISSQISVNPPTLTFNILTALPSTSLVITNAGSGSQTLNLSVAQRDSDTRARLSVPSSVTVAAGQTANVTVSLTGSLPGAGSYEGQINITGSGVSLHVPYNYFVGSGVPDNIFPVLGDAYVSVPAATGHVIAARVVDPYGVPVSGLPVTWTVNSGGGQVHQGANGIPNADVQTDVYGTAAATVDFGSQFGDQIFTGNLGSYSWEFDLFAALFPVINSNGVVNGASFQNSPAAPGSYITIQGQNLAHVTANYVTANLPLAIAATSVSFDVPSAGISVPGHISYISPTQINVQVPWEVQGNSQAQMKVITTNIASQLYTLPLASYGPAVFEYTGADGQLYAAALDTASQLITTAHPAQRGQYISLYANGLGPVTNQPASGATSPESPLAQAVSLGAFSVTIGGLPATVAFVGLAPDYVGLYQLNLVVPVDVAPGVQPLVITGNGLQAKTSLLAVSP
jgi:minor extracellular serine protease Vpr